jgi:hypothetical protein
VEADSGAAAVLEAGELATEAVVSAGMGGDATASDG